MSAKVFKCKSCGFEFSAVVTDSEIDSRLVPCFGCGSNELEVIGETAMSLNYSKKAEASIYCHCKGQEDK